MPSGAGCTAKAGYVLDRFDVNFPDFIVSQVNPLLRIAKAKIANNPDFVFFFCPVTGFFFLCVLFGETKSSPTLKILNYAVIFPPPGYWLFLPLCTFCFAKKYQKLDREAEIAGRCTRLTKTHASHFLRQVGALCAVAAKGLCFFTNLTTRFLHAFFAKRDSAPTMAAVRLGCARQLQPICVSLRSASLQPFPAIIRDAVTFGYLLPSKGTTRKNKPETGRKKKPCSKTSCLFVCARRNSSV